MPIGTSDGQVFEDEFQYAVSTLEVPSDLPRITVTPEPLEPEPEKNLSQGPEEGPMRVEQGIEPKPKFGGMAGPMAERFVGRLFGVNDEERYITWPEKIVRGAATGVGYFNPKTAPDYRDPGVIEGVFEAAGLTVMGPAPIARKVVDGTLGSIAGVGAKTLKKEDLVFAQIMKNRGFDDEQIWHSTGFYQGADKRWRFEIPTDEVRWNQFVGLEGSLLDWIHFPKLFEAYPSLKNTKVVLDDKMKFLGAYHPETGVIKLNPELIHAQGANAMKVLLHEVQHKIQQLEKFEGQGANPTIAFNKFIEDMEDKFQQLSGLAKDENEQKLIMNEFMELFMRANRKDTSERIGYSKYMADEGEREARIVEDRFDLSTEAKKILSPAKQQQLKDSAQAAWKRLNELIREEHKKNPPPQGWGETEH